MALPIKTDKTTNTFSPPEGKTEEEIGSLPYRWSQENGYKEVVSIWKLSDDELDVLNAGGHIELGVGWIGGFPPVSLGVTYEGAEDTYYPVPEKKLREALEVIANGKYGDASVKAKEALGVL